MMGSYFWISVFFLALGTFAIRASFIFLYVHIKIPNLLKRALVFIPVAVLPALFTPAVFYHQGEVPSLYGYERLVAFLFAAFVCIKTKNVFFTILSGLLGLFILKFLLG